jgi:geranylgeranyl reductase
VKTLRTDVLVIGGGPAGSMAAWVLARRGVDTIVVERDFSFAKPCGGGLPSGAFEELNVPAALARAKVRKVRLVSPSGVAVDVELGKGYIGLVERGEFDSALRGLASSAGAQVLEGAFKGCRQHDGGVRSEVVIGGRRRTIVSDWAVAADGVNSRALASVGIKPARTAYTLTLKAADLSAEACEFWFGSSYAPGFYSWVFPQPKGVSVGTGGIDPRGMKARLEGFLRRRGLAPASGDRARGYRIPVWEGGGLFRRGSILFTGDAAGQVMPLAFEGIYYAMMSGRLAAEALSVGRPQDYERLWKKKFQRRFAIMRRLWELFLRDDPSMEKFIALCKRDSFQHASKRLWLEKRSDWGSLLSFMNILRKFAG